MSSVRNIPAGMEFTYKVFVDESMLQDSPMLPTLVAAWRSEAEDKHVLVQGPAYLRILSEGERVQAFGSFVRLPPHIVVIIISGPVIDVFIPAHEDCPDWGYLHVQCQRCKRKYQCTPFDDFYCTPEGDHACGPCLFKGRPVAHIDLEAPLDEPVFVKYPLPPQK